jgi:iron complex outermembrane recepter protein
LYLYDNQTDNYQQDHYQVVSSHNLNNHWTLNANAFVVRGRGYYEQFKDDDELSKYKLPDVVMGNQKITKTDLIRRRWLDNVFGGTTFSLDYDSFAKLKANIGGGYNSYNGQHFGEIIWAKYASNGNIGQRYYDNKGLKTDFNLYGKLYYQITDALNIFADAQIRTIHYTVKGDDNQQRQQNHEADYAFFNPKLGLNWQLSDQSSVYTSLSIANREPNRDDFTESTTQMRPRPETLRDLEWGYRLQSGRITASIGGYYMSYKNQLVLTGQVNDVGNPIKVNAPKSYRTGIEIEAAAVLHKRWKWNGNATLSQNKIQNYTAYIINYDNENGGYKIKNYAKTDISFSPNVIVGSQMVFLPTTNFEIAWLSKYVGRQFLDNTSDVSRQLDAYFTNDLRINCLLKTKGIKGLNVGLLVNNILSHQYESNGYTYSYIAGGTTTTENFYYPQAGRNFLVSVGLRF